MEILVNNEWKYVLKDWRCTQLIANHCQPSGPSWGLWFKFVDNKLISDLTGTSHHMQSDTVTPISTAHHTRPVYKFFARKQRPINLEDKFCLRLPTIISSWQPTQILFPDLVSTACRHRPTDVVPEGFSSTADVRHVVGQPGQQQRQEAGVERVAVHQVEQPASDDVHDGKADRRRAVEQALGEVRHDVLHRLAVTVLQHHAWNPLPYSSTVPETRYRTAAPCLKPVTVLQHHAWNPLPYCSTMPETRYRTAAPLPYCSSITVLQHHAWNLLLYCSTMPESPRASLNKSYKQWHTTYLNFIISEKQGKYAT